MTVDNSFTRETDAYVLKPARFYPEKIPIHHWQLRHYISNPQPDLLYYASSRDIFCLNTRSRVRTLVTPLPFWARCTASGYGYVCAGGGEGGHFAIVKLDETPHPDVSLWLDDHGPPNVQVEQAGTEIVNSISIHKLDGDRDQGTVDDVVAVLTNNDKSIRIFSLTQHAQNTVLELPFPVNHATISPDGRTLVAVGDYQQAYFYDRVDLAPSPDAKSMKNVSAHCMWELLNIVALHVPNSISSTGYFTTAWSPSGSLCAVGSECGYVSVIDIEAMQKLDDAEDAIVVVMPSTRPENVHPSGAIPGAIRTMLFAPYPWDLLIWAEDQGRVCVADLRSGLRIKHILRLDPESEDLEPCTFDTSMDPSGRDYDAEQEREAWRQQVRAIHGRELPDDFVDETFDDIRRRIESRPMAPGTVRDLAQDEVVQERRRRLLSRPMVQQSLSQLTADDDAHWTRINAQRHSQQLTAQEQDVLNAIDSTRRSSPLVRSVNYSDLLPDASHLSLQQQTSLFAHDFPALARQHEDATSASTTTLPTTFRIMRDSLRERDAELLSSQNPELRAIGTRRSNAATLLLDGPRTARADVESPPANRERQAPTISDRTTIRALPQTEGTRLLTILNQVSGIETLDAAFAASQSSAAAAAAATAASTSTPPPLPPPPPDPADVRRRRALIRARDRALVTSNASANASRYHQLSVLSARGDFYDPSMGLRTAGLAMSADGRWLYCACDRGIFEFEINVRERMAFKAIDFK